MTKAELFNGYNVLTEKLHKVRKEYKDLTGSTYPTSVGLYSLFSSWVNEPKWKLERLYNERVLVIKEIENSIEMLNKISEMKKTKEGLDFITHYQEKENFLENVLLEIGKEFSEKFNNLLKSSDMGDWEIIGCTNPWSDLVSVNIHNVNVRNTTINIYIRRLEGEWVIELNTNILGGEPITKKGVQYTRNKGYVTICDHSDSFMEFLNTEYTNMYNTVNDIREDIRKVNEILEDPFENPYKTFKL